MVKLTKNKQENSGPSSAIGIMRFSGSDKTNLRLSPVFVIVLVLAFVVVIIWLKSTSGI